MSIDREALQSQSYVLRQELKQWEKQFASRPNSKPSRSDIKSDPAIEAKYKEYSRIRDVLSMKVGPPPMPESPQRSSEKRKHRISANEATPLKRHKRNVSTPIKRNSKSSSQHDFIADPASPSSNASTPHRRAFVGPTPQKDGHVLGLFDSLDPDMDIDVKTPTKAKEIDVRVVGRPALVETHTNVSTSAGTPRKAQRVFGMDEPSALPAITTPTTESKYNSRTPQSSARRFLLDKFATPSKRKRTLGEHDRPGGQTQQAIVQDDTTATPAFLRRDNSRFSSLPAVEEEDVPADATAPNDAAASPSVARRHTRKPSFRPSSRPGGFRSFTRSLSSLMADINHAYESRYDDDEAAMREAEAEMEGQSAPKPSSAAPPGTAASHRPCNSFASSTTLVTDSQTPDAYADIDAKLLGPDGAHVPSESDSDAHGAKHIYKKRGAKRQTRRVILKPAKRLPKPPHAQAVDTSTAPVNDVAAKEREATSVFPYASSASSDAEADDKDGREHESTSSRAAKKLRMSPPDDDDEDVVDAEARADDDESPKRDLKSAWSATTATTSAATEGSGGTEAARSSMDVVRKATKRMSATAHANFRKLKLRSKGSGGGGGGAAAGGKRWGRRH